MQSSAKSLALAVFAVLFSVSTACKRSPKEDPGSSSPESAGAVPVDSSKYPGGVPYAVNSAQFQSLIQDNQRLVVVDFHADWCGPCRKLAPLMDQVAAEFSGRALFLKVDVDENRVLATSQGIKSIPAIRLFLGGRQVHSSVGLLDLDELRNMIRIHLPDPNKSPVATQNVPEQAAPKPAPAAPATVPAAPPSAVPGPMAGMLDKLKRALPGGDAGAEAKDSAATPAPQPIRPAQGGENWLPPGMSRTPFPAAPPPAPKDDKKKK